MFKPPNLIPGIKSVEEEEEIVICLAHFRHRYPCFYPEKHNDDDDDEKMTMQASLIHFASN